MGDQATVTKITSYEELAAAFPDKLGADPSSVNTAIASIPEPYRSKVRGECLLNGAKESFWMIREAMRLANQTYQTLRSFTPSNEGERAMLDMFTSKHLEHFVHISKDQPGYIAYTPDVTYGKQDRRLKTTPGRYLKKYFPELTDVELQRLTDSYRYRYGVEDINWAKTVEEKIRIYTQGPHSCMAYAMTNPTDWDARMGSHVHPITAYDVPWVRVAYLVRDGKINSRCVVYENPDDPNDKRWIRSYGDEVLRLKLEANGYKQGTLLGAKIKRIPAEMANGHPLPSTWVVPYIDDQMSQYVQRIIDNPTDTEYFTVTNESTFNKLKIPGAKMYGASNSNGLAGLNKNYIRNLGTKYTITREDGSTYKYQPCTCCSCGSSSFTNEGFKETVHGTLVCKSCRTTLKYVEGYNAHGQMRFMLPEEVLDVPLEGLRIHNTQATIDAFNLKLLDPELYSEEFDRYPNIYSRGALITEDGRYILGNDAVRDCLDRRWHRKQAVRSAYAGWIPRNSVYSTMYYGLEEGAVYANSEKVLVDIFDTICRNVQPINREEHVRSLMNLEDEFTQAVIIDMFREYEASSPYALKAAQRDLLEAA